MEIIDYIRTNYLEWQEQKRQEEEERRERQRKEEEERLFHLNFRFPLEALPDELIEFIIRIVIAKYRIADLENLLRGLPKLQKKVLIVSDSCINEPRQGCPLLQGGDDVPQMSFLEYERYLARGRGPQPLIVFFTFLNYLMDYPRAATALTRFEESLCYRLISEKTVIIASCIDADPPEGFHWKFNPFNYVEKAAKSNGATLITSRRTYYTDVIVAEHPYINKGSLFYTPDNHDQETPTSRENSRIFDLIWGTEYFDFQGTIDYSLYVTNLQTELKAGRVNSSSWIGAATPPTELRVLVSSRCSPAPQRLCTRRRIELGDTAGYDCLHIEFLCPKIPMIVDGSEQRPSKTRLTTTDLIIDNLNWSYENPFGKTCASHARGMDQYGWCLNGPVTGKKLEVRCKHMMLIGVPDRYLKYSRWRAVTTLYWKRLEPTKKMTNFEWAQAAVIDCPSLTQLKIFGIVRKKESERARFPQFRAPHLETLVLVSLKGSERCWNVKQLLNNELPDTLRSLTFSAHHMSQCPAVMVTSESLLPQLCHLTIQRMDPQFIGDANVALMELRYLELDVTAVGPTPRDPTQQAIRIELGEAFPALETVILNVPQASNQTHYFGAPVHIEVPENCLRVGVASMLCNSSVSINRSEIEFPRGFTPRPRREVFVAFVRDNKDTFVHGEELMAHNGRPLDVCLELAYWRNFDSERRKLGQKE